MAAFFIMFFLIGGLPGAFKYDGDALVFDAVFHILGDVAVGVDAVEEPASHSPCVFYPVFYFIGILATDFVYCCYYDFGYSCFYFHCCKVFFDWMVWLAVCLMLIAMVSVSVFMLLWFLFV